MSGSASKSWGRHCLAALRKRPLFTISLVLLGVLVILAVAARSFSRSTPRA